MLKKYIYTFATVVGAVTSVFAFSDSTIFVNKPKAPQSLLKK